MYVYRERGKVTFEKTFYILQYPDDDELDNSADHFTIHNSVMISSDLSTDVFPNQGARKLVNHNSCYAFWRGYVISANIVRNRYVIITSKRSPGLMLGSLHYPSMICNSCKCLHISPFMYFNLRSGKIYGGLARRLPVIDFLPGKGKLLILGVIGWGFMKEFMIA